MDIGQKYYIGDYVRVRRFNEIDTSDIGNGPMSYSPEKRECLNLSESTINEYSEATVPFEITRCDYNNYIGAYLYHLRAYGCGHDNFFVWSQGMLAPYQEEDLPGADTDSLFSFLSESG